MTRPIFAALVAAAFAPFPAAAVEPAARPDALSVNWVTESTGVRVAAGVTYATAGGERLKLDLAVPAGKGPFPVVVCFHGGAWRYGSRADMGLYVRRFAENGYAAATVSYRLAPRHQFPAPVEDGKTAVRFLRAHAAALDLDPDRVAALGVSAGGHLALLLGLTDSAAGFDGPLYPDRSSRVKCVVDFFGPTDMALYTPSAGIMDAYVVPFLGPRCKTDAAVLRAASPLTYATKAGPPTLVVHGNADVIVPIVHSERLVEKMRAAGTTVEMMVVAGEGHGWGGDVTRATALRTKEFLDVHLKGAK